jgi:putative tryptophan/tyrosine transport system substrate-binding protein
MTPMCNLPPSVLEAELSASSCSTTGGRLPLVSHRKEWVQQGALFSHAPDLAAIGRLAAPYVTKILNGTKPGDLPVQEPTKFELVIIKTAKALIE